LASSNRSTQIRAPYELGWDMAPLRDDNDPWMRRRYGGCWVVAVRSWPIAEWQRDLCEQFGAVRASSGLVCSCCYIRLATGKEVEVAACVLYHVVTILI
jgi:hypothetical protein